MAALRASLMDPAADAARQKAALKRGLGDLYTGPAVNPVRGGANRNWDGRQPFLQQPPASTAPAQAPTVATQGAPASVAQSGGGVTPPATPFMAARPAVPIAPATAPVTGAPMTPGPVQAPAPVAAGVVHQGPFPGTPGTNTLTRDIAGSVSTEPGAAFVPVSQLKVGEASVVVPPGAKMQPEPVRGGAFDNQQGFLDSMEAATNALRGVDRTPNFTNKQVELQQAGVDRLKRGFMSPRERADTLTNERRAADRGFMGDKLQSAENIEKTRAQGAVDVAKEAAKGGRSEVGRFRTTTVKNADGSEYQVTTDTVTGAEVPAPPSAPSSPELKTVEDELAGAMKKWNEGERFGGFLNLDRDAWKNRIAELTKQRDEIRSRLNGASSTTPAQADIAPDDQAALDWANSNPNDPRAAKILQRLNR